MQTNLSKETVFKQKRFQQDETLEKTSTSNPFLCAADFFLQLGSCKEAVR